VVHHSQLLNRLVREGRLTPIAPADAAATRSVTYHDPCYIGRHNGIYAPPREPLAAIPGATLTEMPRNAERSFCCGAGGARMWMEEKIGTRINSTRTAEAVATGAEAIVVGCPFCRVMLSDGLTAQQAEGSASEDIEVVDLAQLLLAAVRRAPAPADPRGQRCGGGVGRGGSGSGERGRAIRCSRPATESRSRAGVAAAALAACTSAYTSAR
jgi:Fe-S oxidoreductase